MGAHSDEAAPNSWVAVPHSAIACITGRSVCPRAVRPYSVFGGIVEYSRREMRPQPSSSFSSFDRIRSLIGGHALRTSEKRRHSFRRSAQTILAFHRPPVTREVKVTGHWVGASIWEALTKNSVLVKG